MKNGLMSLGFGLIGAIVFSLCNTYWYQRPIAIVRVNDLVANHLQRYGKQDMSAAERERVSGEFASRLDSLIKRIGEKERVTLLVSPAVLTDVPDYTGFIESEIERGIHGDE